MVLSGLLQAEPLPATVMITDPAKFPFQVGELYTLEDLRKFDYSPGVMSFGFVELNDPNTSPMFRTFMPNGLLQVEYANGMTVHFQEEGEGKYLCWGIETPHHTLEGAP